MFIPNGTPRGLEFMLVLIELISYVARIFSLSIRLFANMLAGHALLKILSSFTWALSYRLTPTILLGLVLWLLVLVITILESLIAFLQAYVYLTLNAFYIKEVIA